MNRALVPVGFLVLASVSLRLNLAENSLNYALYHSQDRGRSWTRSDSGLRADARINALAASGKTLISGTDAGIFISTNAARSWNPAAIHNSQDYLAVEARVISLAVLTNHVFAGTSQGFLLVSSDRGATWQTNQFVPRRPIRALHALSGSLYVGTDADHVYKSSDLGKTWTEQSAGLPPHSQISAFTSVNGHLFAGLYSQGLHTWNLAEQKWTRVGASADIRPLVLATLGDTLIAGHNPGGIYWSDNLGQNWKRWSLAAALQPTPTTASDANSFPALDSILNNPTGKNADLPPLDAPIWEMSAGLEIGLAGAGSGIYSSTDGRTWTRAVTGLPASSPGIAFLIQDNLILAAIHEKSRSCDERKKVNPHQ